jgi:hypothetical protein
MDGSFGDEPGILNGATVLAMSIVGMLAMKEQYPACATAAPGGRRTSAISRSPEGCSPKPTRRPNDLATSDGDALLAP